MKTSLLKNLKPYFGGLIVPVACTLINLKLQPITGQSSVLMIYLLGVFLVASRWGHRASITASVCSALLFAFYFAPPYFSLWMANIEDLIGLPIMITVGYITSNLLNEAKQANLAKIQADNEALRNSLLSAISHDLRTPLTRIVGAATMLIESNAHDISQEEKQDFCRVIFDEAQRMSELMNKILDMAKLSTGKIAIHQEWNTLEEIIGGALSRLEKNLVNRTVNIHLPENLPLIWIDSVLFEQVLVNLIENAIKYTPSSSPIDINASYTKELLTLSISDYGSGIPNSLEDKIFDKFYRVENESTQSGVGLGLALCRSIIEAHRGTIQAKNINGKGAAFFIRLPLTKSPSMPLE
ncbi:MAG: ATP-binding protein [Methylococcaceae bacterium]